MKRYILLLVSILVTLPAMAITRSVTNNHDAGAGSLRQAIADAQPGDCITFSETNFHHGGANNTIVLNSEIVIDKNLTIEGPVDSNGKAFVLIKVPVTAKESDDNNTLASDYRLFTILGDGYKINIANLQLKGGDISMLIGSSSFGGVIYSDGPEVNIDNIVVSESMAHFGGAIHKFHGNMSVKNSLFTNNIALYWGGAICLDGGDDYHTRISNSRFLNNTTRDFGGAIDNVGCDSLTIKKSFFDSNKGICGGAVWTCGVAYFECDTLINNFNDGQGGAIDNVEARTIINNCMIVNNKAEFNGSAINNTEKSDVYLLNSTVTDNKMVNNKNEAIYIDRWSRITIMNSILTSNYEMMSGVENNVRTHIRAKPYDMVSSIYGVDEDLDNIANNIHNTKAPASSIFTGNGIEISSIGEASRGGTLVGRLGDDFYYRDMGDNKWKSFTTTNTPGFDVANTTDYGLGAGAEVFTTSLNGVSRVWTHNYYNTGAYAIPPLSSLTIDAIPDQTYTGSVITLDMVIKDGAVVLTKDVDYEVGYTNNINVGTANVTITGKGTYSNDLLYTTFRIVPKAITSVGIVEEQAYTGVEIKPPVLVRSDDAILKEGTDYEVVYTDNINVGTATATVTGKGNYSGVIRITFRIVKVYNLDVLSIVVTGAQYDAGDNLYVVDCGRKDIEVTVVTTDNTARVFYNGAEGNPFTVDVPHPGFYIVDFTVVSQDGLASKAYSINMEKRFEFDEVVVTRWNNTLTVINNPANNGGYNFTSFKWFRNGQEIATGQSISAGSDGTWLNANDLYYVVLTANEYSGSLRSCEGHPNMKSTGIKAWPNPAALNETVSVEIDLDAALLPTVVIEVYNVLGVCIQQTKAVDRITQVKLPATPGVYILKLKGAEGFEKSIKIVVK